MLDFSKPLMLDGDIPGAMAAFGPGQDACAEEWLLQNPGLLFNVLAAFRDAGADILPSMTFSASELRLSDFELGGEHDRLNTRMVELTRQAVPETIIAGGIGPAGHLPEPFGPLPYADLADAYARQAVTLARAGASLILLEGMSCLCEARAAVIGAREANLPVFVMLGISENGLGSEGADPLAGLICLQELGISAFGLSGGGPESLAGLLLRLAPYAKAPLMARPGLEDVRPEEVSRRCWELLASGARVLGGGRGATSAHMQAMRALLNDFDYSAFPPPPVSEDPALLLCDDTRVFFLDEEDMAFSPPIDCSQDISASILEAASRGAGVLLFHIKDVDDAYRLAQNIRMSAAAACFLADSSEALEMGLLCYNGRAMVDSRSKAPPGVLRALADKYGAVIRLEQS